jgi:nucleotide-binding universal stress UspA family protein
MYQRILVPIDGSFTSDLALQEAIKLAKQMGASLELVHIYEDAIYLVDENYFNYEELQQTIHDCGKNILTQALEKVRAAAIPVETRLIPSNNERIANLLMEEVKRWQAELIVVGTHGRSGFSRLLLGSVAEGIIRMALVPVLLIRGTKD